MRTLREYRDQAFDALSPDGKELIGFARHQYPSFMSGNSYTVPSDLEDLFGYVELSREEKKNARIVLFSENIMNAAETITRHFVSLYDTCKHDPNYTLGGYLLRWKSDEGKLVESESADYLDILSNLISLILSDGKSNKFDDDVDSRLYGGERFLRLGMKSVLRSGDEDKVAELLMSALPDGLKKEVHDIVYDVRLAKEAATAFLDAVGELRENKKFILQNFLMDYYPGEGLKRRSSGLYCAMFGRLTSRSTDWKKYFYSLLDEPVKTRVSVLDVELEEGQGGILFEQELALMESLAQKDALQNLLAIADEGSDAEDLFVALNVDKIAETESKVLRQILRKGGKHIRRCMGLLRTRLPDSLTAYDRGQSILDMARKVNSEDFARNEVISSILYNTKRKEYDDKFRKDPEYALGEIRRETETPDSDVHRKTMERVLAHFELRSRVRTVKGIVPKLKVKSAMR